VEAYGVFVSLHKSAVRGLVHISQIERAFTKDLAKHYTPGQVVTVRVLSVDVASKKVNLSMKDDLLVGSDDEGDVDMEDALHKVC
jgi:predicted RNA-binding protein with RPS1 domain